jgi:hypothetical protein
LCCRNISSRCDSEGQGRAGCGDPGGFQEVTPAGTCTGMFPMDFGVALGSFIHCSFLLFGNASLMSGVALQIERSFQIIGRSCWTAEFVVPNLPPDS